VRKLIALLSLTLVVMLGACDPNAGTQPQRAPGAGQAQQPAQPPAGAQQPAPAGDPGQHNTQPGEIDLHVSWVSENKHTPACEWSKNATGATHPCEGLKDAVKEGKDYIGLWEREETGKAGDTFQLNAHGWPGTKSIECAYFWKGKYHALLSQGTQCGGTFVLD
jgi:hypothetical protein